MVNFVPVPDMSCMIKVISNKVLIKVAIQDAQPGDIALMFNGSRIMPHLLSKVEVHTFSGVVVGPGFNLIHEFGPGTHHVSVIMKPEFKPNGQRAMRLDEM